MTTAGRTLVQTIWCEKPTCRKPIMRIWLFQGRRQCENVSCPCDNALGEALHAVLAPQNTRPSS